MTSGRQSALVVRMTAELGVGPEAVAAALRLRREEVELALERYEESTSRDGTRSRCPGWQLVVRRAVLADGERAAADRHLQLCEPCTRAERRRARASAARRGVVGAGGTSALLSSGRVRAVVVMAAVLAAGAFVAVGDVPLLGGGSTSTAAARAGSGDGSTDSPDAAGPGAGPDEGPGSDDTPAGDPPSGDRPTGDAPSGDRPTGDGPSGDRPPGDRPSGGDAGTGRGSRDDDRPGPDDGPVSGPRGGDDVSPAVASGLLLGPADRYSAGRRDVVDFLRSRGHAPVVDVVPTDRDDLLAEVRAATRPGAGLAVVVVVATPELALGGEPALDVDGVQVTAAELSRAVGSRRVLLALDLVGSAQVSLQPLVDALAGPDRFVVAALSNQADDLPVRTAADGGASAFSELFWQDALIGGAGDTDDDGRVSVEEAFALARDSAPVSALSARPVASDRLAGETAVTGR